MLLIIIIMCEPGPYTIFDAFLCLDGEQQQA